MMFLACVLGLVSIASARTCKQVCHSDKCKNRITNWDQWYTDVYWYTENGCCAWGSWQCSLCCDAPPTPAPSIPPQCAKITLDEPKITSVATVKVSSLKNTDYNYNQCRQPEQDNSVDMTRSESVESSKTYQTDQSLSHTWGSNVGGSVSVEASFGVNVPVVGGVDTTVAASVETGHEWGGESSTSSSNVIGDVKTNFQESSQTLHMHCPANKKCTFNYSEKKTTSTVTWEARSHCILANGDEWDAPGKVVTGKYTQAVNNGFTLTPTIDNCEEIRTQNNCDCKQTWNYRFFSYNECAKTSDTDYTWCFVIEGDSQCDYSKLKKYAGSYWDTCDPIARSVDSSLSSAHPGLIVGSAVGLSALALGAVYYYRKKSAVALENGYQAVA